jgi:PilZ domain-containing protein
MRSRPADVLLCLSGTLREQELRETILWRAGVTRQIARLPDQARNGARDHPRLIVVDRDLPWAIEFISWVRDHPDLRAVSIAAVGAEDAAAEFDLIGAGANAVLALPPDESWDRRLSRLMQVAPRRNIRVPVMLHMTASPAQPPLAQPATSINVSESGMLVECSGLRVGMTIEFAFRLPGWPGTLDGRGRVCRQEAENRSGMEFTEVSDEFVETIRAFARPRGNA